MSSDPSGFCIKLLHQLSEFDDVGDEVPLFTLILASSPLKSELGVGDENNSRSTSAIICLVAKFVITSRAAGYVCSSDILESADCSRNFRNVVSSCRKTSRSLGDLNTLNADNPAVTPRKFARCT